MDTQTSIAARQAQNRGRAATFRDYWGLIRPRIVAMVLFTLLVAALVSGDRVPGWQVLVHALAGNGLVIAGAIALNQRMERRGDARMARTSRRPLPSGRLTARQATRFALVTSAAGFAYLALWGNWAVLGLAGASWAIYVWVYTPLKTLTTWQTPVGAVAGAMPALLGAAAAGAPLSAMGLTLFGVVSAWQLPHAMAVASLYRHEFRSADVKLVTVADPSGRRAGLIAVGGVIALIPLSLVPLLVGAAGWRYGVCAAVLGTAYLAAALGLLRRRDDAAARRLLWASILYLPLLLTALLAAASRNRAGTRLAPQVPGGPSNTPAHGVAQEVQWPSSVRFHSESMYQSRTKQNPGCRSRSLQRRGHTSHWMRPSSRRCPYWVWITAELRGSVIPAISPLSSTIGQLAKVSSSRPAQSADRSAGLRRAAAARSQARSRSTMNNPAGASATIFRRSLTVSTFASASTWSETTRSRKSCAAWSP